ncbi:GNAT family N-acetyltransferase [Oceanirhabdus seepicola]|uniref:GNAT family N-acetyltransferase n=1 Tax=Oceanirhabdus seepicola TaxID=2828781 RepID=A0A9J6NYE3_9CLOT|nr:GNAT family N-acetyltransferase [Oceanirhabdus seepicola]MCM1989006.1 GNAT family N-acetyltransferase [Oceanirhabdus seepicola]
MNDWNINNKIYELGKGYTLEAAEKEEYSKYYAVYFKGDVGFKKNFKQKMAVVSEDDFCFWIKKDDVKIGGVFLEPNFIQELFLIPPFDNAYEVLKLIKRILIHWSDRSKDIEANVVIPSQVEIYEKLGFRIVETGRWMLSPTRKFDVKWDDKLQVVLPNKDHTEELGKLFYEAFKNAPGQKFSLKERTEFVEYYFEHNSHIEMLNKASSVIFDRETNELIGVCLISEYNEWPLIYDIAVREDYRGRGVASKLLKKSLTVLKDKYSAVRLHVEGGNDAETVYYDNGFLPGIKLTSLIIPSENL